MQTVWALPCEFWPEQNCSQHKVSGQASRCVIQSMQTWRLSLDFPQMQPFKSFFLQSSRTQKPHTQSLKSHTHKNSCKRRKDNEEHCGGAVSQISPCFPHPEPAHAGSQSALRGVQGKHTPTETTQIIPFPQILQDFNGFSVGLPFHRLLQSKTIFQNEVLQEKVNLFFWVFFSSALCSPREKKVIFTRRDWLNLRLSKVEPKWKFMCRHLPARSVEALLYPALKRSKEGS